MPEAGQLTDTIDIAEQLRQNSFLTDRNAPSNPLFRFLLTVLAYAVLYVCTLINAGRFHYRQLAYSLRRRLEFGDRRLPQQIREDVANFAKVPNHVALILKPTAANESSASLDTLLQQSVEGASWCIGVGSHELTLYERSGMLRLVSLQSIADVLASGLVSYFSDAEAPLISVRRGEQKVTAGSVTTSAEGRPVLEITLACEEDGRPMLVELTKEYAEQLAAGSLQEADISVAKIDEDVKRRVGNEPDLLVSFDSNLDVAGFSPWLLRVTELFCLPDNNGVFHYMVFYAALQKFAKVKVNLGA